MKRPLLTYSAWISLLLLALVACRSAKVSYPAEPVTFAGSGKMTFKARISWGEKEVAGLLLVKEDNEGELKIAFYNELGMTYLEGTLDRPGRKPDLNVVNIAPAIDFNLFIKNFERCMQEAFKADNEILSIPEKIELKNHFIIYLQPLPK